MPTTTIDPRAKGRETVETLAARMRADPALTHQIIEALGCWQEIARRWTERQEPARKRGGGGHPTSDARMRAAPAKPLSEGHSGGDTQSVSAPGKPDPETDKRVPVREHARALPGRAAPTITGPLVGTGTPSMHRRLLDRLTVNGQPLRAVRVSEARNAFERQATDARLGMFIINGLPEHAIVGEALTDDEAEARARLALNGAGQ